MTLLAMLGLAGCAAVLWALWRDANEWRPATSVAAKAGYSPTEGHHHTDRDGNLIFEGALADCPRCDMHFSPPYGQGSLNYVAPPTFRDPP